MPYFYSSDVLRAVLSLLAQNSVLLEESRTVAGVLQSIAKLHSVSVAWWTFCDCQPC